MTEQIDSPRWGGLKQDEPITPYQEAPFNRRAIQRGYSTFARQQRPTALLTLTVKEPKGKHGGWLVTANSLLQKANLFFHWVNADLFGRKYQKKGLGLTGFGCIENQANHQPHAHLAITTPMLRNFFQKLKETIFRKIEKISLFEARGTDIQLIGNSDEDFLRVGDYLAKNGRMVTLGTDGIL